MIDVEQLSVIMSFENSRKIRKKIEQNNNNNKKWNLIYNFLNKFFQI